MRRMQCRWMTATVLSGTCISFHREFFSLFAFHWIAFLSFSFSKWPFAVHFCLLNLTAALLPPDYSARVPLRLPKHCKLQRKSRTSKLMIRNCLRRGQVVYAP
ncbi:hypothetical protein ONS95_015051 [Cadophora gregata]|uniref:uncharacterized protein n=1 Tax=Cadophora gregata TaxID=51156 RepID=UPI0026DAED2F|nr:uncharacterized protein ONS95_015051 [Cadophora gregata]KAK0124248.1 hypothetical protein ONS95_015051 [Cadophora gregata]